MSTVEPLQANKNILGYTLNKRIGHGGFGEVWSAVAPGGLQKAVKIVYGYHDEKRAQAELKALDRVKDVRHPFLLSLERIEVFEGQLIVVAELADKSLADLFNEFLTQGEAGIPRESLLKYIRNAAEALDYISDEHGLQHLDIKPENLLMVSGHVKVADFGLIKDLLDASQSLMTGMTPAYAAPELFDGRPGKKSDQYSLAIVYQEMLTGQRPFPGTTPAQLAAQHVHGKPNLRPLPQFDQAIIGKALSKDPGVRYANCRELVEELSNRKRAVKKPVRRIQAPERICPDTESKTINLDQRDVTSLVSSDGLPFRASEIKLLAPPECEATDAKARPILIVGIGATANRVVKHYKQQLLAQYGSMHELPSVRLVCLDTDRHELTRLCLANDESALTTQETLLTPLSKPEDYRERGEAKLSWLSRRWIYNIPRSLQTEGLRPLGRLAFADHFEAICNRLESALKEITLPESLAKTADSLEMNPGELQPQVFIVTSISGGVGSGMTLDLAYTLKLLLAEQGLKIDTVTGILLHSTYQRNRDPGLSSANTFAFLTEMRHFVEQGYPGDESLGLPEFEDESPFDFTYYNELGNDLSQTDFDLRLSSIAEYLYLSTTSKCAAFFDRCRAMQSNQEHFSLRTFGLSLGGPSDLAIGPNAVHNVARTLIQRWIKGSSESTFNANEFVNSGFQELRLAPDSVLPDVQKIAERIFEGAYIAITADALDIVQNAKENSDQKLASYLDGALGCPSSFRDASHVDPEVCFEMEEALSVAATKIGSQLTTRIMQLLNEPQLELSRAKTSVKIGLERLESAGAQINAVAGVCDERILALLAQVRSLSPGKLNLSRSDREKRDLILQQYCQVRYEEFVLRYVKQFYRGIRNALSATTGLIRQYESSLNGLGNNFLSSADLTEAVGAEASGGLDQLLAESIEADLENHVTRTERQIFETIVQSLGGYTELLHNSTSLQQRLPAEIRNAARRVLAEAYQKISLENVIAKNEVGPEQLVKWLTEKIRRARPLIDDCGGASRVLLGLPSLSSHSILPELLQRQFNLNVKPIHGTQGNVIICFEAEDVSLANIAYRLLQSRPDAVELVRRLHSRSDVQWSTLNELL